MKNGWSILILGKSEELVIKPGVATRKELVQWIKPSFWKRNDNIKHKFTDDTYVEDLL